MPDSKSVRITLLSVHTFDKCLVISVIITDKLQIAKDPSEARLTITQSTVDGNSYREYLPQELHASDAQLWKIPLNIRTTDDHLYQLLLDRRHIQIPMLPLG